MKATSPGPRRVSVLPEHLCMSSDLLVLERTPVGTPQFEQRLTDVEHLVLAIRHHHDQVLADKERP